MKSFANVRQFRAFNILWSDSNGKRTFYNPQSLFFILLKPQTKTFSGVSLAPWHKDVACILTLALLLIAVFWPVLFQGRTMLPTDEFDTMTLPLSSDYGPPQAENHNLTDAMMQSYPWKVYAQQALRIGMIAYWNPLILGGYAQYAESRQSFDVFNLLLIPFDLPWAFGLIIVLQLFAAGIGMYMLLRWHRLFRAVALMFAAAWMFNGMFLTHGMNLWVTATFCWVPFALAMLLRFYARGNASYLMLAGVFTALSFLGSTLQSAVYMVFCLAIVAFFYHRAHGRSMKQYIVSLGAVFGIAFCLSAIMWLPTLELFLEVIRHGWLYSPTHGLVYSISHRALSLGLLLTFFIPELLGQVRSLSLTSVAGVHPLDFSGYLGFPELLMATWAVFSLKKSGRSVRGFGWLMILGFLLPICTPLFSWLYHRFFIVGTLGAVVIGAERFDNFVSHGIESRQFRIALKWALGIVVALFAMLIVVHFTLALNPALHAKIKAALLTRSSGTAFADGNQAWVESRVEGTFHHYSPLSTTMFVPFFAVFAVCGFLLQRAKWRASKNAYVLTLFALSVLPMMFWWRTWLPMLDTQKFPLLPANRQIQLIQQHGEGYRIFADRTLVHGRQYILLDNIPSMYGLSDISGYESELPRCFYGVITNISPSHPHVRALGALGVKYLMYLRDVVPAGNLPVADTGAVTIYDNPWARPRATILYRSEMLPNDSLALRRFFDDSDTHNSALFTAGDGNPPLLNDSAAWTAATITSAENNSVTISAKAERPGYLVLSDTYYPGWKCWVDGSESQIYRANFAMRAVYMTPGEHHVVFRFEPQSFRIGSWISIASVGGVLTLFVGIPMFRRRRNNAV